MISRNVKKKIQKHFRNNWYIYADVDFILKILFKNISESQKENDLIQERALCHAKNLSN